MRRHIKPEDKARLVLCFLKSEEPVAVLCKKHQISENSYYKWRTAFLLAGTEALRRPKKRVRRKRTTPHTNEKTPAEVAEMDLRLRVQAIRDGSIARHRKLTGPQRREIVEAIRASSLSKRSAAGIAGIARCTYYRWRMSAYLPAPSRPPQPGSTYVKLTDRDSVKAALFEILHSPPLDHGFNRTTWKVDDLQLALKATGLHLGKHAIRNIIRNAGYRWLKAKKVLTSRDPDYRAKLDKLQSTLSHLTPDEGFFSIDEYGPFALKRRAGRRLVAPGEIATVPQWQRSRGFLIMTAALELSTNQITHFYSERKNTDEIIKLLDIILGKNKNLSCIYLSWDAASWHASKKLTDHVAANNVMARVTGSTRVELTPLPAGAQFLNVIEAVFSGMARAIIHNSDYQSKDDAKSAIDRYIADRNEYFKAHPNRAGDRIWGEERQATTFSVSNNCKDPRYR